MKDAKLNSQKLIIIVLSILLVLAILFIAATMIRNYNIEKRVEQEAIYKQGMQAGYESAVKQLVGELAKCNQVPIFADNLTVNAVAVECLQQQQQALPME